MIEPRVGDYVLCPCGEFVRIEQGINALIPELGHRYHFLKDRPRLGAFSNDGGRTHHIIPGVDQIRRAA